MQPDNPEYQAVVREIFKSAPFVKDVGIELVDLGPGWCETRLVLAERHMQQTKFAHAGVMATMADHTAGASAGSLVSAGQFPLTVEFKINLLRPAVGDALYCRAEVIQAGATLIVAESSVHAEKDGESKLVAKAMVTLAVVTP